MQKLLIAVLGLIAMAISPANAADMSVPLKTPVPAVAAWTWTGCYVGLNVGGGIHHSSWTYEPDAGGNIGAVAGGQVGCNYQVEQVVVGLEGELDWASITAKDDFNEPICCTSSDRAKNTMDASIAARFGYAFNRLLAYTKVGVAWGRFTWSSISIDQPGFGCTCTTTENAQQTVPGLLLGLGFEYALWNNWTAKVEYNYINYGDPNVGITETCSPAAACTGRAFLTSETIRDTKQLIKVGVNLKFN